MRYIVEIDDQTSKGAQLVDFIEKLRAPKKAVSIRLEQPLTDEEMVLPGIKPSKTRLKEWLKPQDDEEEFTIEELKTYVTKIRAQNKVKKAS